MRTSLRTAALLTAVTIVTVSAQPAQPAQPALAALAATPDTTWSPALSSGSGAGVAVTGGVATLDPRTAFLAPPEPPRLAAAAVPDLDDIDPC